MNLGLCCSRVRRSLLLVALLLPALVQAQLPADAAPASSAAAELAAPVTVTAAAALSPAPAPAVPWLQDLQDAALLHGVDAHLLQALVKVESNFNPLAISRAGAVGLLQLMPRTASSVAGLRGNPKSLRQQLQDPATNLHAGAQYLRSLMDGFSERLDLVLAAYHTGAGRVHRAGDRVPANGATPQFVQKVTALYASIKASAEAAERAPAPAVP